jgi:thiosulfate/3-mercaptopyruvate sulfurtransferase
MVDDQSRYLVETDWLNERLDDRGVRVLDVTGMLTSELKNIARERVYDEGHIPGAVFFDVASAKGALSDPDAKLPWTWPPKAQVETAMAAHGVGNDTKVVLYAASPRLGVDFGPMWCTRAWWVMHHFGVDCAILNGGYEKWLAEGRPISTEPVTPPSARLLPQEMVARPLRPRTMCAVRWQETEHAWWTRFRQRPMRALTKRSTVHARVI